MSPITITIDGRAIATRPGATVLEAALDAGIYIPHLCHSPGLKPYGGCRMCLVQIEGARGPSAACTTTAADGMTVRSDEESVNRIRRMLCELIIADHPLVCLTCVANQNCELQTVAAYLGVTGSRLRRMVRRPVLDQSNPFYVRDLGKCILCGTCTRACQELRGEHAIEIAGRGYESRVAAPGDRPIGDSRCVSCGECVDRCPVGALHARRETLPPTAEVRTTCVYCGCGCGLVLGVRSGRVVRVRGDADNPVNRGSLGVTGRFGLDVVHAPDRLTRPLMRRGERLEPATWDEALAVVADRFVQIRAQHGADALAGLSSAKCTNEENYVFQKFMRAAAGTNNVDHCARLCHASTVAGLAKAFGSGAMTNSIDDLAAADCILVAGSNTTEAHPLVALRIVRAVTEHGAKLIVADPRAIELTRIAHLHLRQRSGTDVALFNAMIQVILAEGLGREEFIASRTEGIEDLRRSVDGLTLEQAEAVTGVPADQIRAAARQYATAPRAAIVYSMGITQHTTGTDNVLALANLALLTGNIGREGSGVNPLRGQNNVQGACDMGALPNVYPGYRSVQDPEVQAKFEQDWRVPLSSRNGLTVVEMMHAAAAGTVRALYIMGENPMLSDPNANHVKEALETVEFLVVQDIFLSETAALADVVLPSASFAEKDGTFTNTERRVQRVRKAVAPPGEARQDWTIVCELGSRIGYPMRYASPAEILDEIAALTPIYGGIGFDRLEGPGLQWPCPDRQHPGTPILHRSQFTRGKGRFHPTPFREAAELPDEAYPYLLTTGRYLYHFHTGTLTRRVAGLEHLAPPAPVEIHPDDGAREGIADGDAVEVESRRGRVTARAVLTERSPRGTVFMAFHYREAAANALTIDALDPVAKIPELKVCAVRVRKAEH